MKKLIPFNKPFLTGNEIKNILKAHELGQLAGDGYFSKYCQDKLRSFLGVEKVLLTHSCTAALEMAALCLDIVPGDEVIMPSYTFVSTANAFVLRGATPIFIDINQQTLNIDDTKIEQAITSRTKAIVVVHYAGVSCNMEKIMEISRIYDIPVVEDAAQAINSFYKGQLLGSFGDFSTFSFHETKNIISGEGGALVINNPRYIERAEIIREKGTNRSNFMRGMADKYTWVDKGSSYLPSELISAFLAAQLDKIDEISQARNNIWNKYFYDLSNFSTRFLTPKIPKYSDHNAHIFYILLHGGLEERNKFIAWMKTKGVITVFHYVPLHNSPYGLSLKKTDYQLEVTEKVAQSLVRLPLWIGLENKQEYIISCVKEYFK